MSETKLVELTNEQNLLMSEVRDYWINKAIGGDCSYDRARIIDGVNFVYSIAKLCKPKFVFIVESPMGAKVLANVLPKLLNILSKNCSTRDPVGASVGASLMNSVGDSVGNSVWTSMGASVRDSVWDPVGASLMDSVGASVGASMRNYVWASLMDSVWTSVGDSVWTSVEDSVKASAWTSMGASVRTSVGASVRNSVWDSVWDSAMDSVRDSAWTHIMTSVWSSVGASVWTSVRDSVSDSVGEPVNFDFNGLGHDSGWLAFCDFFRKIKVLSDKNLDKYADFVEAGVWDCISYKHVSIVCIRPMRVQKNLEGRLHNPSGAAVSWKDGYENYFINGVGVSKEFVMTPAEKLDPHILLTEKNAEVRREIVRKIGIERIILKLGAKSIDKQGEYELLLFNLGDGRERPYLKMRNPSIHTWHIEGVPVGTKTVAEALNFRKPEALGKIQTADNGADWYQQGDVCIWPRDAKFVKPFPAIIT